MNHSQPFFVVCYIFLNVLQWFRVLGSELSSSSSPIRFG
jgi:hypothetical protein